MTSTGTLERLHPVQRLLADALAALDAEAAPHGVDEQSRVDGPDGPGGPGGQGLWSLGSGELDAVVTGLGGVVDRLRARQLEVVTEAVRRGRPAAVGAGSPTVWLAGLLRVTPGSARRAVTDAAVLAAAAGDPVTAPLAADARDGRVGLDQALIAAAAVAALPTDLAPAGGAGDTQRARAVEFLRDQARVLDPDGLRRAAAHLGEVLDPDGADTRLAEALERAERRATATRGLHIGPDRDGTVHGRFTLPTADAAVVRAALHPLAAPHPTTTTTTTTQTPDQTADGTPAGTAAGTAAGDGGSAPWAGPGQDPLTTATTLTRDDRTHPQRMADALVELCDQTLTHGNLPPPAGNDPNSSS